MTTGRPDSIRTRQPRVRVTQDHLENIAAKVAATPDEQLLSETSSCWSDHQASERASAPSPIPPGRRPRPEGGCQHATSTPDCSCEVRAHAVARGKLWAVVGGGRSPWMAHWDGALGWMERSVASCVCVLWHGAALGVACRRFPDGAAFVPRTAIVGDGFCVLWCARTLRCARRANSREPADSRV